MTTGKRAKTTKLYFWCPNLSLCHWSSQLFDLRAPSSTDVPVLLLNQPITDTRSLTFRSSIKRQVETFPHSNHLQTHPPSSSFQDTRQAEEKTKHNQILYYTAVIFVSSLFSACLFSSSHRVKHHGPFSPALKAR